MRRVHEFPRPGTVPEAEPLWGNMPARWQRVLSPSHLQFLPVHRQGRVGSGPRHARLFQGPRLLLHIRRAVRSRLLHGPVELLWGLPGAHLRRGPPGRPEVLLTRLFSFPGYFNTFSVYWRFVVAIKDTFVSYKDQSRYFHQVLQPYCYSKPTRVVYLHCMLSYCNPLAIQPLFALSFQCRYFRFSDSHRLATTESETATHTSLLGYIFFLPVETIVLRARYSSGRSAVTHCLLFQLIARPNVRSLCKFTSRPSGFDTQWTLYRSARGCPLRVGCLPRPPRVVRAARSLLPELSFIWQAAGTFVHTADIS